MSITRIVPMKQVQTRWHKKKVSREFNDVKVKALRQLCTYQKGYEAVLYVLERSRGSTTHAHYDYKILLS